MMFIPALHSIASLAFERLLYSLAEGSLLALAVTLALRFVPQKSSRTTFVIWFSALLASAFLPLLGVRLGGEFGATASSEALITIPISIALYASLVWLVVVFAGLARVVAGVLQLRRLRRDCQAIRPDQLGSELTKVVEDFKAIRSVSILISPRVQVPTAIGFFKPAVLVPEWMIEEGPCDELKHVVLHELEHLRRRDDWTNLVQKIVGTLLFFHPAVWWMQRELSMHREMACDDAVLAQTANPRTYAECLAHVAEKSFMRRQIALAQAAVSRMRQLTRRVNRILDPNRRAATQLWKPAIPAVATLALLSGISGSWAPGLVRVDDGSGSASASPALKANSLAPLVSTAVAGDRIPALQAWPAQMKSSADDFAHSRSLFVPAKHASPARVRSIPAKKIAPPKQERPPIVLAASKGPSPTLQASNEPLFAPQASQEPLVAPHMVAPEQQREFVLVIETRQTVTAGPNGWQVSVQQLRWLVPVSQIQKPPSKI